MQRAIPDLPQNQVEPCRAYVAQEAQHHRQHVRFNRRLTEVYPALRRVEGAANRFFRLLERRCSSRFNLAFAAGSETIAYSAARWAASNRRELFGRGDEVATSLFLWHLAEEVEHKSAAHEVYTTLHPSGFRAWLVRAVAVVVSLLSLFGFVVAGTSTMLWAERLLHRPMVWYRLVRWGIGFAFEVLPNVAVSLTPGHHPDQFADPAWYEVWLREYDSADGTLPIWTERA
jgi:predicted metal-dependent hydrolase